VNPGEPPPAAAPAAGSAAPVPAHAPGSRARSLAVNFAVLGATLLLLALFSEVALRIGERLLSGTPLSESLSDYYDPVLGWQGRKVFGDPKTTKRKILVLGDSYTEGLGIPNKDLYAVRLGDELGAEIFSYGAGGYGTLQEYLALDRFVDEVKPDLIVLQVCRNDFINNLPELQEASYYNNNPFIRPYLIDGKIVLRNPPVLLFGRTALGTFLDYHSRLFYFLTKKTDKFKAILCKKGYMLSVEEDVERSGPTVAAGGQPGQTGAAGTAPGAAAHPDPRLVASAVVTGEIVRMFGRRAGTIPVVAFTVDDQEPYVTEFRRIFAAAGIPLLEEPQAEVA
jgi:lysophospholipase L1-like esterase